MERIKRYFPSLTSLQLEALGKLEALYGKWNEAINVISRKDIEHLYERHVLHSMGIAKVISFSPGTSIMDVGTGGGFPGIPLAILFPQVKFHLVDATGKKIKVVNQIAAALELNNVTTEHTRIEQVTGKYDFIVSRAVTAMPEFIKLTEKNIQPGRHQEFHHGIIYLKGGDIDEELKSTGYQYRTYPFSAWFKESFFESKAVVYLWK
ncbi:MAG: 16S rRNA (guanine(527)-N(7))-methyltransferase RsmG [Lentimicrobium sp.]|jgi:16S rRNA (guanine527-N7)-methyltransferase|nr:16S rRNA (guanine(527)-N(7))-methyltransferase RsmG [Lentimicrobium sp.]MDD2526725.1 16S rRNA (guanine(527)-N(7))-methyltransferase RsmG [Lentimicrobiaceae bacterium]MDD4596449.1 16S rRNA (guanine(527)-N(7))-methyltransferase RsmG [Lentimicrobiaceae bacterium]MDY0024691.1 16S rRNA (guanine(527)-N(7))-methyltransferase RsmG [Lentimicrobium sp.]HAH60099.1 16S rRNA (guanine(527)-N(7))-methyltransferase RsmG [Bacteroidales bacterium]